MKASSATSSPEARGTVLALGFVGAALAAAFVPGPAGLVGPAYAVAAPVIAWRLARRDPVAFIAFVPWLWILTPEVRRVANFTDGWNPSDPIMAAPGLASIAAVRGLVGARLPKTALPLVVVVAAVGYGFAIGIVQAGPSAAAAGLVYWLPPGLVGLLAMSDAVEPAALRRCIGRTAVWAVLVVGLYGLVQFFWLPDWDAAWMVNTELTTIGLPVPQEVRVFSTLNAPGPLGVLLAALLIALSGTSSRVIGVATVAGVATLGLSQVRSGWVGWALGLVSLLLVGRRQRSRGLLLALVPMVAVLAFGGTVQETIRDRFDQTAEAGTNDDSLTARVRFHREMVPEGLADPIGNGIGSTGSAAEEADPGADSLGIFDGAIPESLFALGGLVGSAYLVAFGALVRSAFRGVRRRGDGAGTMAAATAALAVQVLFGNPLVAGAGVLFAVVAAAAIRAGTDAEPAASQQPDLTTRAWLLPAADNRRQPIE